MSSRSLQRVVFFADASARLGAGHQMRCLAIAEELRRLGSDVVLGARSTLATTESAWRRIGADVVVVDDLDHAAFARAHGATFCVVDDYGAGDNVERRLRDVGVDVLAFDDHHHAHHEAASLVLNPAARNRDEYGLGPVPLVGLSFALIRDAFRHRPAPSSSTERAVLVTLGATDPGGFTRSIVERLRGASLPVTVTAPAGDEQRIAALAATGARVVVGADLADLVDHRAGPAIAVSAASTSALELASAGVAVVVVGTADNQRQTFDALVAEGAACAGAFRVGDDLDLDAIVDAVCSLWNDDERAAHGAARARAGVDGNGAARVVRAMHHPQLVVRRALATDAERLFRWANDPVTRAASFQTSTIAWPDHLRWFDRKRADARTRLYVGESPRGPIGQVRFDLHEDGSATIGVGLAHEHRGQGLAAPLLTTALEEMRATTAVGDVVAEIKPDNQASLRSFARAGFGERLPAPPDRVRLVQRKSP